MAARPPSPRATALAPVALAVLRLAVAQTGGARLSAQSPHAHQHAHVHSWGAGAHVHGLLHPGLGAHRGGPMGGWDPRSGAARAGVGWRAPLPRAFRPELMGRTVVAVNVGGTTFVAQDGVRHPRAVPTASFKFRA